MLAAAAFLRLRSIEWGLPGLTEEATPFRKAVEFWGAESGRFTLNPRFFNYPSLTFYLHFIVQAVAFVAGFVAGAWRSLAEFRTALETDPVPFIRLARYVTVAIAVATIVPVWAAARRIAGIGAGMAAALFLALNPLQAAQSRFLSVDIPLAFCTAMALLYLVRLMDAVPPRATTSGEVHGGAVPPEGAEERTAPWSSAGLWLGLAASCKYPGALLAVPLLALTFLPLRPGAWKRLTKLLGPAAMAFAVTSPFVILDLPDALHAVQFERYHMMTGHFGGSGEPAFVRYAADVLPHALGWPGFVIAVLSLLFVLVRFRTGRPVVLFALVALVVIGTWKMAADRYLLLVLPALLIVSGAGLAGAAALIPASRGAVPTVLAALLVALPGAATAVREGFERGRPSTREAAERWVLSNMPRRSLVAAEYYSVESLRDSLHMIVIPFDAVHPHVYDPAYSLPYYAPFEYVVLSSAQYGRYLNRSEEYPAQSAFYDGIVRDFDQVAQFEPGRDLVGPTVRIFRRKEGTGERDFRGISGEFYNRVPHKEVLARFLTSLAAVLSEAERDDLALAAAEQAVSLAPLDPKSLTNMAALRAARGDYLTALKTYQRALEIAPEDAVLHYNLGRLYQGKELWSEAAASYMKAMNLNPRFPEPYLSLAICQVRLDEIEAARGTLRRFLSLFPDHPRAKDARAALQELS